MYKNELNTQTVWCRPVVYSLAVLVMLLVLLPRPVSAIDLGEASKAVVKLFVTRQAWSMRRPWVKGGAVKTTCSGFFIDQGILTNAHCVTDATYIQVELPGVANKVEAKLTAVNHQVDLALVDLKDASLKPDVTPISFDVLPELREKVVTVGYPAGGRQVSFTEGVVSRIDIMRYAHSGIGSLMVQTDAAINSGNSGGPVFSDRSGASLGVATQIARGSQSIGYFIPAPVVNQFLKDLEDGEVDGIPSLGIYMQPMENPAYRESMKLAPEQSGVRVFRVAKASSADGHIEKDDVVLSIEGHQVFNDGRVPFRGDGKIGMGYYVTTRQLEDYIKLEILRDGQVKELDIPLKPYKTRIIPRLPEYDMKPRYFERAGIIFRPVESRYVRSLGKIAPGGIRQYLGVVNGEIEGLEELVVVSNIYDASVNKGYSGMVENIRVMEVNGKKINRFEDVVDAFKSSKDEKYYVVEFEGDARIILDVAQVEKEQDLIRQRYNIGEQQ